MPCVRSETQEPWRRAQASEPLSARNAPAFVCWTFRHAHVLLGVMVVAGDRQVMQEGEHLPLPSAQPLEQMARWRLLDASPLPGRTCGRGRGIGRPPGGQQIRAMGDERPALGLRQLLVSARARLRDGRFQLQAQSLPALEPRAADPPPAGKSAHVRGGGGRAPDGTAWSGGRAWRRQARSCPDPLAHGRWRRWRRGRPWGGWRRG
jgi:hypothetical protein